MRRIDKRKASYRRTCVLQDVACSHRMQRNSCLSRRMAHQGTNIVGSRAGGGGGGGVLQ